MMKSIIIRRVVIASIVVITVLCFFCLQFYNQKRNSGLVAKEKFSDYIELPQDEVLSSLDTLLPGDPGYIKMKLAFLNYCAEIKKPITDESFKQIELLIQQDSTPVRMGMLHYIKSRSFFGIDYYRSYREGLAAKEYFEAAKDTSGLILTYLSLGYRFPSFSNFEDDINKEDIKAYRKEFLKLTGLSNKPYDQFNHIFTILTEDTTLDKDISYYESFLEKMKRLLIDNQGKLSKDNMFNSCVLMGNIYREKGYDAKADSMRMLTLKIADCKYEYTAIYIMMDHSKYKNNTDSQISLGMAAIKSYVDNGINEPHFLTIVYDSLERNFRKKNDYKKAYLFQSKKDSMKAVENLAIAEGQISNIEGKYKLKEKDFEIKTTEREKERIFFFLVISVVLAIIAGYMGYYNYKSRLKLVELNDQQDDIKRVISHDLLSPLSSLETLTARLSKNLTPGTDSAADANRQQLYIQNIRSLCHNLVGWLWNDKSTVENKVGGKELLDELVYDLEGFFSSYQCIVEMDVSEYLSETPIKDPNAIKVILRNLLTNSVRHGKSSRIKIKMQSKSSKLVLSIQDNGYPIDEELASELQNFLNGKSDSTTITGLGLYLTGKFLSRIKGKYEIRESKEEEFVNEHVVTIQFEKIVKRRFLQIKA